MTDQGVCSSPDSKHAVEAPKTVTLVLQKVQKLLFAGFENRQERNLNRSFVHHFKHQQVRLKLQDTQAIYRAAKQAALVLPEVKAATGAQLANSKVRSAGVSVGSNQCKGLGEEVVPTSTCN